MIPNNTHYALGHPVETQKRVITSDTGTKLVEIPVSLAVSISAEPTESQPFEGTDQEWEQLKAEVTGTIEEPEKNATLDKELMVNDDETEIEAVG